MEDPRKNGKITSLPVSSNTPRAEIFLTSTSGVLMPSGTELILILLHNPFRILQLLKRQSIIPPEFNLRFQPKLGLPSVRIT